MLVRLLLLASILPSYFASEVSAGWFPISRYGCFKTTEAAVWQDLDKIYSKGKLDNLYRNPCNAFDLEFLNDPSSCHAPLSSDELDSNFDRMTEDGIPSWYQNLPVGQRKRDPLAMPKGN